MAGCFSLSTIVIQSSAVSPQCCSVNTMTLRITFCHKCIFLSARGARVICGMSVILPGLKAVTHCRKGGPEILKSQNNIFGKPTTELTACGQGGYLEDKQNSQVSREARTRCLWARLTSPAPSSSRAQMENQRLTELSS